MHADQATGAGRRAPPPGLHAGRAADQQWTLPLAHGAPQKPAHGAAGMPPAQGAAPTVPSYGWGGDPLDAAAAVLGPRSPAELALRFAAEAARMNAVRGGGEGGGIGA